MLEIFERMVHLRRYMADHLRYSNKSGHLLNVIEQIGWLEKIQAASDKIYNLTAQTTPDDIRDIALVFDMIHILFVDKKYYEVSPEHLAECVEEIQTGLEDLVDEYNLPNLVPVITTLVQKAWFMRAKFTGGGTDGRNGESGANKENSEHGAAAGLLGFLMG